MLFPFGKQNTFSLPENVCNFVLICGEVFHIEREPTLLLSYWRATTDWITPAVPHHPPLTATAESLENISVDKNILAVHRS